MVYAENVSSSAVAGRKLMPCRAMFQQLREVHPTLVWSQSAMKDVLAHVYEQVSPSWPRLLTSNEKKDWQHRMALRVRTACRHINQGFARRSAAGGPVWLRKLFSDGSLESEEVELGGDDANADDDQGGVFITL